MKISKNIFALWYGVLGVFSLALIVGYALLSISPASAGLELDLSGYAWSENIGWISFRGSATTSSPVDYGVMIDSVGKFSGRAWSPNVGWISFKRSETGKPPADPFDDDGLDYIAKRDGGTNAIYGWGKILPMGEDGWLRFGGVGTVSSATFNVTTGELSGWMWNGNDNGSGIGWVSLNCTNTNAEETSNSCATSQYAVTRVAPPNLPPNAPTPELPINGDDIGKLVPPMDTGSLRLTWSAFSDPNLGDTQQRYRVELRPISGTLSTTAERWCTLASSILTCTFKSVDSRNFSYSLAYPSLDYGQTYQWRVQVQDQHGEWSVWSAPASFKMPAHALPTAEFSMAPERPAKGENVQFTDQSDVYGAGNQIKYWQWDFGDGTILENRTQFEARKIEEQTVTVDGEEQTQPVVVEEYQNPQHTYSADGARKICLTIIDQNGYVGEKCLDVDVGAGRTLPIWERITPF